MVEARHRPSSDAAAQHGLRSAQLCCEAHFNEAWLPRGVEAVALGPRVANAVTACSAISCQRIPEPRPAVPAVQNVIKARSRKFCGFSIKHPYALRILADGVVAAGDDSMKIVVTGGC